MSNSSNMGTYKEVSPNLPMRGSAARATSAKLRIVELNPLVSHGSISKCLAMHQLMWGDIMR